MKNLKIDYLPKRKHALIGIVEWFRIGEKERVENILSDLKALGIQEIRTGFSWAEWYTKEGEEWYKWLIPRLKEEVNILPCFTYTPPNLGLEPKVSSPPRSPKDYTEFLESVLKVFDGFFEWAELWNEPNNLYDWDWRLDPSWEVFTEMIGSAAQFLKKKEIKTVLGGMSPIDPNWIELLCQRNIMQHFDAVGIHGFPGTWEFDWSEWPDAISKVREVLSRNKMNPEIWITAAGYSTWRHDEFRQLRNFANFMEAPVQRAYWHSAQDIHPDLPFQEVFHGDERHYHFGLKYADGRAKLLYRVWAKEGLNGVKHMARFGTIKDTNLTEKAAEKTKLADVKKHKSPAVQRRKKDDIRPVLITGGAGFIGTNLAHRLLSAGTPVIVFDNLSRPGVEENLQWLIDTHGNLLQVRVADVRDPYAVRDSVRQAKSVFHFAAQVAVTTSLENPVNDFEVNLRGTLNVLEALRSLSKPIPLLFTSTNKVYGELIDIKMQKDTTRYEPANQLIRLQGISEKRHLDFHSPYGCSKGSADQYIIDYARIYNIPNVVFRMSCIYGTHQFGTEDQGWVAFFLLKALRGEQITIYGDGLQVRDILFVDDLIDAMLKAHEQIDMTRGNAYNIGGGPDNTVSLVELLEIIEELHGQKPQISFSTWRQGDQRYYVSNTESFHTVTGWNPQISTRQGVEKLYSWLLKNRKTSYHRMKKVAQ
ncbi:MAG: NAD-dependent epimerase/dehydratase family protein [Ignavibacteria bacterium]|jgi:CDP-paratose 2-epimerase|nr:NAD-dependent epimerase/dehydratase family protein [Ignavibacteria bacterium]